MRPYSSKQVSHPPPHPPDTEKEDSLPPHCRKPQVRGADRCMVSLVLPALWLQALYTLSGPDSYLNSLPGLGKVSPVLQG